VMSCLSQRRLASTRSATCLASSNEVSNAGSAQLS